MLGSRYLLFPALALNVLEICFTGWAQGFSGPVIAIIDGDTIEVLHDQHPERIRLSGIDCPEKGQAYGNNAKHAASSLALGKEVTVQTYGHDKYKRTIGDVILPDGTNVNHQLVKEGWCWWYRKYAPGMPFSKNRVEFNSAEEAKEAGYRQAGNCPEGYH